MATRSMIYIQLKPEDKGKTIYPDPELLKKDNIQIISVDTLENIPEDEIKKMPPLEIAPHKNYIGIYHHWDGYPEETGKTLLKNFNTYEKALNLITYGDESSINETYKRKNENIIRPYGFRSGTYRREDTDIPLAVKDLPTPYRLRKTAGSEYIYLFKEDEWYFSEIYGMENEEYQWQSLKDYLTSSQE